MPSNKFWIAGDRVPPASVSFAYTSRCSMHMCDHITHFHHISSVFFLLLCSSIVLYQSPTVESNSLYPSFALRKFRGSKHATKNRCNKVLIQQRQDVKWKKNEFIHFHIVSDVEKRNESTHSTVVYCLLCTAPHTHQSSKQHATLFQKIKQFPLHENVHGRTPNTIRLENKIIKKWKKKFFHSFEHPSISTYVRAADAVRVIILFYSAQTSLSALRR